MGLIEKKLGYLITIIECTEDYLESLIKLIEVSEATRDRTFAHEFDNFLHLSYLHATSVVELAVITKNLESAIYISEQRFFMKATNLIVYEMINTYNKYSIEYRRLSENNPKMRTSLNELNSKLKKFRKKFNIDNKVSRVRNKTIAHLDKDVKEYTSIVSSLNKKDTISMAMEFLMIISKVDDLFHHYYNTDKGKVYSPSEIEDSKKKLDQLLSISRKRE
ncbi:hypothetical protein [uncultured Kordia sp.]|uniref:hypothetical protein n=1 Tax=uncultured Kordia sp. TaxID=507699 RepID=UPI00261410D3|nr:hypothetical protein [uncultured Kordia sp.]